MGLDGEKTYKQIFQQNVSNGTKRKPRNHYLRDLVNNQNEGEIEDFGEFKAVVYRLSGHQPETQFFSSNSCKTCNTVQPANSISNISQPSEPSRKSQPSQLSSQASLLISITNPIVDEK